MQRHPVTPFNPKSTIEIIEEQTNMGGVLTEREKIHLVDRYLDVSRPTSVALHGSDSNPLISFAVQTTHDENRQRGLEQ